MSTKELDSILPNEFTDLIDEILFTLDIEHQITWLNESGLMFLQTDASDLPISIITYSHLIDIPHLIEQIHQCHSVGYLTFETSINHPVHGRKYVRIKLKSRQDRSIIGVGKDITREKQRETKLSIENEKLEDLITYRTFELQKTKIQYHSLINGAADIIFSINRDLDIMIMNDAGCLLIGLPLTEIVNRNIEDIFPEELSQFLKTELQNVFLTSNPINREHTVEYQDVQIHLQTVLSPIVTSNGSVTEVVGISRNITNVKELQREIDVERQTAIQSNKLASIGRMATGVAHEINQPLNHIKLSVSMNQLELEKPKYDIEKIKHQNNAILEDINRMSNIIKHIREFGRIENDYLEPVDIHEAITNSQYLIADMIKTNNINFVTHLDAKTSRFLGGKNRFEQVYINLVTNACDAIDDLDEKNIFVTTKSDTEKITFIIMDNGPGIRKEIQKNIFDPFFTTKPFDKGTGIGLSIVYQIIKSFGGDIRLVDDYDEGACFEIELPILKGSKDEAIMR